MYERNLLIIPIMLILQQPSVSIPWRPSQPEQIHIAFGDFPQDIVVTWVTFVATANSYVWYKDVAQGVTLRAEGFATKFSTPDTPRIVRYIHRVLLQCLKPNTLYVYRCGSKHGMSRPNMFRTNPEGTNWSPRLIIFGDMGWKGSALLPYLEHAARNLYVDAIAHIGDIAYNLDSFHGSVGDEFLRMIEPVASSIPYMTTMGNHEQMYNFSHYKNRFSMPGDSEGYFYSFDLGPAHFVAISTEVYYFTEYGLEPIVTQYNWLQQDLKWANSERRMERPWIIVLSHRPMYCSSDTNEDCSRENSILRCCSLNSCNYGLEYLFHSNKVDLIFSGHMHYYERSWPLYNNKVYNGSCKEPYRNPGATVHIITGAAGMKCGTESASYVREDWFPSFSNEHSYTLLTVTNRTHLHVEQISATRGGAVIDSMWLIKDRPRP